MKATSKDRQIPIVAAWPKAGRGTDGKLLDSGEKKERCGCHIIVIFRFYILLGFFKSVFYVEFRHSHIPYC